MKYFILIFCFCSSLAYGQSPARLVPFVKDNKWGYANTEGRLIVEPIYDYVAPFEDGYAMVLLNGLRGLMNESGQLAILVQYNAGFMWDKNYAWAKKGELSIIIDKEGHETIPKNSYDAEPLWFKEGLAGVYRHKQYGFVNVQGIEVIACQYDSIDHEFQEGLVAVQRGHKWAYINTQGVAITDFKYDEADNFKYGRARVYEAGKGYGFIDRTGKEIIPLQYDRANPFYDGCAWVERHEKVGFIDPMGKVIIPLQYTWCNNFSEGLVYVESEEEALVKLFNKKGKCILTSSVYDDIDYFSEGMAPVTNQDGQYGYLDNKGKLVIPFKYDFGSEFHSGLAQVELDSTYGYINKQGKLVIPFIYEDAADFHNGIAHVKRKGKSFYIDTNGREYIEY